MKRAYREFATDLVMKLLQKAKEEGYNLQFISRKTGISAGTLKGYFYGEKLPSIASFIAILEATKIKEVLNDIAELIDCVVIEIPSKLRRNKSQDLILHTSKITKETADVLSEISKSLEDGKLTYEEKKKIIKEADEAIQALVSLKESLKEEDY